MGGYRICREKILTEEPPQAVFAVSDELAMGVIKAAREENIPLPEGLAVAGFTGSEAAAVITPALTTMEHPRDRIEIQAQDPPQLRQPQRDLRVV